MRDQLPPRLADGLFRCAKPPLDGAQAPSRFNQAVHRLANGLACIGQAGFYIAAHVLDPCPKVYVSTTQQHER